ncbi:extracellular solute-binding protein [Paenibacillus sp. TAB 01]|uniref:extracellular solute-binding protein n=1 Tax=Paenibacillus sp. TAB 01 TaxID=3368988 RepID=UPI0037505A1C
MRMRTIRGAGLVLAITQLGGLAACTNPDEGSFNGSAPGAATDAGQHVTLTLQTLQSDKGSPAYTMEEKIVNDFMKLHPNIQIQFDRLNTEQQKIKLKTQAASGEVADITMVNPGAQMKPYVDSGVLAPLNDIVDEELRKTFHPEVLSYYTFDEKLYALPYNLNVAGIFYNKEVFAKEGLAVPHTFEELLDTAQKLKDKGHIPMAIGAKDRWTTSFLFMNILQRLNGRAGFLQDVLQGRRTFNDPVFVQALSELQRMIQAGVFEEGATSVDSLTASGLFRSGRAAMYYIGTWEIPKIEISPEVRGRIGLIKFPTVAGKGDPNDMIIAPGTAYALSAKGKHMPESKLFLKYFTMQYPKVAMEMGAAVGLSQKVDDDFIATGYTPLQLEALSMFKDMKGREMNFDNVVIPAVTQTHLDLLQNLFVQAMKPEEVAKEHQLSWEANTKRK